MSESQNIQNIKDSEEMRDDESSSLRIQADEGKQDSKTHESNRSNSENISTTRCDEPEKNISVNSVTKPLSVLWQRSLPETEQLPQSKAGECNLLPVLVERLRSALELSCLNQSQSSEDQLPLEDSGVDSEEDLRMWASNIQNPTDPQTTQEDKPKLDLKFLEELLISDIHTALAHLQDTLKRVDIGTLTRYNSSLDSSNKLHLLRLISNLIAKLKVPEEAKVQPKKAGGPRRRRTDRHTIGVSSEELAQARKWLENNSVNSIQDIAAKHVPDCNQESDVQVVNKGDKTEKAFDKIKDKHIKDAINQQQSLQNKNRETENHYENVVAKCNGMKKSGSKDDLDLLDNDLVKVPPTYYNPSATINKHNKFMTKKAKIKRANTIDIPNYLKLQADGYGKHNGCIALRRPIDISDKILSNIPSTVIPSFEPKTENDRKFLALINKNNDTAPPPTSAPFKSFSYRQTKSIADKNWNNRFSNIKTTFDKPKDENNSRQNLTDSQKRKEEEEEANGLVIGSLRLPYGSPKPKLNGFRHAPTSPFQKIEKTSKEEATPKYGYAPKSSGGLLQAKVKMFDHRERENIDSPPIPPPRTKGPKFNKENIFTAKTKTTNIMNGNTKDVPENENHSFYKPFISRPNKNLSESKYNELIKSRLSSNFEEEEKRKEELKSKRFSDNIYQNIKRNSMSNCYEMQKRFSHPINHYEMHANNVNTQTNIPNLQEHPYEKQNEKKSKSNKIRQSLNEEILPRESSQKSYDVVPGSNLQNKYVAAISNPANNVRVKNVAVQTGNETLLVSLKEERTNTDYNRQYPAKEAKTLCNNVSVQTLSDDAHNYTLNAFLNDVSINKTPVYCSRDLEYQRLSQNTPRTDSIYSPVASVSSYHSIEDVPMQQQANPSVTQSPKLSYQEYIYPSKLSLPKVYTEYVPGQYNNYYTEPDKKNYVSPEFSVGPIPTHPKTVIRQNIPPIVTYSSYQPTDHEMQTQNLDPRGPVTNMYSPTFPNTIEKKIQNQDISSEGVVTRFTGAIGTITSASASPDSYDDMETRARYINKSPIYVNYNESMPKPPKLTTNDSYNEIQRHNMLQQNLVKKVQGEQLKDHSKRHLQDIRSSPLSDSFNLGKVCTRKQSYESPSESHGTLEKVHMFEEKRNPSNKLHFRPVNVPVPSKPHLFQPFKLVHPKFNDQPRSPIQHNISPIDTSDEYLMTCAAKPSRIVLSKSESWHQLAISKGTLQVPTSNPSSFQKPPKPKSPSSMRFSKQYEASCSSENVKKMEDKIQQYFSSGTNAETKVKKRQLQSKKNFNALAKSNTMPHLYDEKIFDDNVDVDKAFDSLFKEATCTDERF